MLLVVSSVQCPLGSSDPWGCTCSLANELGIKHTIWMFSKNSGFSPKKTRKKWRFFHYFHHPFWGTHPYFWKHLYTDYNVQCIERWEHESRHEIFHVCFWVSALTCTCQMFDVTTVIILCEWEIQGFNVVFVSSPIEMFIFFWDKLLGCQKHPYSHNIHRHTHICAAWI